jgi:hypothetical protein
VAGGIHQRHARELFATLTNLGRIPYLRMMLAWTGFALLLVGVFWLTHGGFAQVKSSLSGVADWFTRLYR